MVEKENKLLRDQLASTHSQRQQAEIRLTRDLKAATSQLKQLATSQSEKEAQLAKDLARANQLLKELTASMPAISQLPSHDSEVLAQQNAHLKAHNSTLRAMLGESLQQASRCATPTAANQLIDKQLQQSTAVHKLVVKAEGALAKCEQYLSRAPGESSDCSELTQAKVSLLSYI